MTSATHDLKNPFPNWTPQGIHWAAAQAKAKAEAADVKINAREISIVDEFVSSHAIGTDQPLALSVQAEQDPLRNPNAGVGPKDGEGQSSIATGGSQNSATAGAVSVPRTVKHPPYMALLGPKLLVQGYLPIPIRNGTKIPHARAWQTLRMTTDDIRIKGKCGIGILTGQGEYPLSAIDIDVKHPSLAALLTRWCRDNLPATVERIGDAPKIMFVFRAPRAGIAKRLSLSFTDPQNPTKPDGSPLEQRIEFLGDGQQFVAYATHPATGKPYEWIDLFEGLANMSATDLPILAPEKINELIEVFEREALQHGLIPHSKSPPCASATTVSEDIDSMMLAQERSQAIATANNETFEDMEAALESLDLTPRDEWIRTGNNLACFKGTKWEAAARGLWEQASAKAATHDPVNDADKWDDLAGDRSDFRAIFTRAAKAGWENPRCGKTVEISLTAAQIIEALQKKTKQEILDSWAALTAQLPPDAAEEVIESVKQLTGLTVRPLRAALKDAHANASRARKAAEVQRRVGRRMEIPYHPENRTAHADQLERLIVKDARPGECVTFTAGWHASPRSRCPIRT